MNVLDFLNTNSKNLSNSSCSLSDKIWDAAETAFTEEKSCSYLKEYLASEGFTVESNTAGIPTAFKASFGSGKPVIGLLAEYDALSGLSQKAGSFKAEPVVAGGNGHGCGHNLLGAGCAHAGVLIKRYLEESKKSGTVIVFGCPAEEGGSGKTIMAGKGVFKDLDCAISWHPGEYSGVVPASTMANIQMIYKFKGKASHAATSPHMGRSALDAVELMNVGANYLREHIPTGCMLHYAVLNSGGFSPNVVQSNAESTYLIRGPRIDDATAVRDRVNKCAQGAAIMTETEVEVVFKKACSHYLPNSAIGQVISASINEVGFPDFDDNDRAFAKSIQETTPTKTESSGLIKPLVMQLAPPQALPLIEKAFSSEINTFCLPATKLKKTVPGSTDVGDVSLNCPTSWFSYVTCAQGTPAHSWQMVSQGKSNLAHKGMLQAGKILALSAVKIIEDSSILDAAWEEFRKDTGNKPYVCPIPNL